VNAEIPLELQMFLWGCIDQLPPERDYLQVFELSEMVGMQQIIHSSEQPEYKKVYALPCDHPITAKVYTIDSGDYSTMLLASEY
jgi:hypothetical protein